MSCEEPPLIGVGCSTTINVERAYRLLIHMFRNEQFGDFRAFDMAFEGWGELLGLGCMQTFNISNEIIESMNSLFSQEGCTRFRRILVISPEQLIRPTTIEILKKFQEQEESWRNQHTHLSIETKVFIYPDIAHAHTRSRIRELHDFAIFN